MTISPRPGEIWLAYVRFLDHPDVGKVRPVIVLETRGDELLVLAAKVTSRDVRATMGAPCVPVADWKSKGLSRPSYVRLDQRFALPYADLLRGAPIGSLSRAELEALAIAMSSYMSDAS